MSEAEALRLDDMLRRSIRREGIEEGISKGRNLGIEEGKSLGIEEGKSLGIEEGKTLGIEEMIRNMLNNNDNILDDNKDNPNNNNNTDNKPKDDVTVIDIKDPEVVVLDEENHKVDVKPTSIVVKNDNLTESNKSLPKTGENHTLFIFLAIFVILAAAISIRMISRLRKDKDLE